MKWQIKNIEDGCDPTIWPIAFRKEFLFKYHLSSSSDADRPVHNVAKHLISLRHCVCILSGVHTVLHVNRSPHFFLHMLRACRLTTGNPPPKPPFRRRRRRQSLCVGQLFVCIPAVHQARVFPRQPPKPPTNHPVACEPSSSCVVRRASPSCVCASVAPVPVGDFCRTHASVCTLEIARRTGVEEASWNPPANGFLCA